MRSISSHAKTMRGGGIANPYTQHIGITYHDEQKK
jgi:hypothetical protein